jgi:hypothetical protein
MTDPQHLEIIDLKTPGKLIITTPDGREACVIDSDGNLTFGDGINATTAASAFILAVERLIGRPTKMDSKKLDRVHQLIVSPDFKIAGGLVKVSSLKEALE